jgi:hypothetical protein
MAAFLFYIGAALLLAVPGCILTDYFNIWELL